MTDPDCQESRPACAAEASAASAGRRPGFLFSDSGWAVKLALALGLFGLLCRRAEREIHDLHPPFADGALSVDPVRGKEVRAWGRKVLAVTPDGFDIESDAGPFHVVSSFPPPVPGQFVVVVGRIDEPRRLVASAVKVHDHFQRNRGINYALSSITVLVFLVLNRRRFRFRLPQGLFRSRY